MFCMTIENNGILLEMDGQVHESYALVLQFLCLHLSCVLDLVKKLNWVNTGLQE